MAWEQRNGRSYYYRKKRVNGRVKSEYVGAGLPAGLTASEDAQTRLEREQQSQAERQARENEQAIDQQLDSIQQAIEPITEACLLGAGFHKHRGQWRKQRNANQ